MKNKIKIIFFDIDGTLYSHGKYEGISESSLKTILKLKENSYKLALCTSRSFCDLKHFDLDIFNLFDAKLLMAGTCVIIGEEKTYYTIDDDNLKEIIAFLEDHKITYRYCLPNDCDYLNQEDYETGQLFYKLYYEIPPVKKYEGEKVNHLNLYFHNDKQIEKQLLEICNKSIMHPMGITSEVSPMGVDKGEMILKIAEKFGFKQEEVCAFGDGYNDITMLSMAGLGIAMGNARDEVKKYADYVTDHIDEDGIYKACKHFGFIEE